MQKERNDQRIRMTNAAFMPNIARLISEGHTVTLPLRGYSMRPFLEDGRDKALLTKAGTLKKGDVVLALTDRGSYALHRIVNIDGTHIVLRGDGNIYCEHCLRENVIAIATGFYRKDRNKMDSTEGRKWKAYSWLWTRLLPLRRCLLFLHRILFRLPKRQQTS